MSKDYVFCKLFGLNIQSFAMFRLSFLILYSLAITLFSNFWEPLAPQKFESVSGTIKS